MGALVEANGTGKSVLRPDEVPREVAELAGACVAFVHRALGVTLDYQLETLPVLDHYLEEARAAARERPETAPVVAHASGAYFGEVLRRRHASWWRTEGDDPTYWAVQLQPVYLSIRPIEVVHAALLRAPEASFGRRVAEGPPGPSEELAPLELDEEDRVAIAARLAELPPVSDAEYHSLSTLLEVIDIAVEAIRARQLAAGEGEAHLGPDDYEG